MLLSETCDDQTDNHALSKFRILVLCTGNSARSIMAEAIFNTVGAGTFQAYSAGSCPTGIVNPMALKQIRQLDLPADMRVRSKSWDEFCGPDAPELDLLLTVCDNAAAETCPSFSGDYQHIHWGFPDPAGSSDNLDEERDAFARCFSEIKLRVEGLVSRISATDTKGSICRAIEKAHGNSEE